MGNSKDSSMKIYTSSDVTLVFDSVAAILEARRYEMFGDEVDLVNSYVRGYSRFSTANSTFYGLASLKNTNRPSSNTESFTSKLGKKWDSTVSVIAKKMASSLAVALLPKGPDSIHIRFTNARAMISKEDLPALSKVEEIITMVVRHVLQLESNRFSECFTYSVGDYIDFGTCILTVDLGSGPSSAVFRNLPFFNTVIYKDRNTKQLAILYKERKENMLLGEPVGDTSVSEVKTLYMNAEFVQALSVAEQFGGKETCLYRDHWGIATENGDMSMFKNVFIAEVNATSRGDGINAISSLIEINAAVLGVIDSLGQAVNPPSMVHYLAGINGEAQTANASLDLSPGAMNVITPPNRAGQDMVAMRDCIELFSGLGQNSSQFSNHQTLAAEKIGRAYQIDALADGVQPPANESATAAADRKARAIHDFNAKSNTFINLIIKPVVHLIIKSKCKDLLGDVEAEIQTYLGDDKYIKYPVIKEAVREADVIIATQATDVERSKNILEVGMKLGDVRQLFDLATASGNQREIDRLAGELEGLMDQINAAYGSDV